MLLFVAPEQEPVQSTAPLFTERCRRAFRRRPPITRRRNWT